MAKGEETVSPHRWNDIAMVFQGAMNAFNPVKTDRRADRRADAAARHRQSGRAARTQAARAARAGRDLRAPRGDRYPHEFSGGMRQRAAIAMALACSPKVLLADEPTTALDVMVQAQILDLLVSLTHELGLAMILVTHDLPVVAQVCERAAVMYAGKIAEQGRPTRSSTSRATRTRACCSRPRPTCTATTRCSRSPVRRRGSTGVLTGCPFAAALRLGVLARCLLEAPEAARGRRGARRRLPPATTPAHAAGAAAAVA